jgi:hypothetical protein
MKSLLTPVKLLSSVAAAAAISAVLPFAAQAQNTVDFGDSWDGPQNSLQNRLDQLIQGGTLDTSTESGAELFKPIADKRVLGRILFEVAKNSPQNEVGIYNPNNPTQKIPLFPGYQEGGDVAVPAGGISYDQIQAAFGDVVFGFYLKGPGGEFYSEVNLNAWNGNVYDQFVAYQGDGELAIDKNTKRVGVQREVLGSTEWIIAFEDLRLDESDKDYNDFVAYVKYIEEAEDVPEPATMLGLAAVAGGGFLTLRRRRKSA